MSDEYEFYHGLVLRQLIVGYDIPLLIRPFIREGRINAYAVSGIIGAFIKHSTKRMTPWRFTFTLTQISDLLDLEAAYFDSFAVFVCGDDGVVTLDVSSLHQIVSFEESDNAWVRIDRRPRSQYSVSGNRGELQNKVSTGIGAIQETLNNKFEQTKAV